MKLTGRRLLGLVLLALVGSCVAWWRLNAAARWRAARADFEWFSTLGFPDVKGCPYVRVATGVSSQKYNGMPTNTFLDTFLLASNADSFTFLDTDLRAKTVTNSHAHTPQDEQVGFELLDLRREIPARLKEWQRRPIEGVSSRSDQESPQPEKVFTLACAVAS